MKHSYIQQCGRILSENNESRAKRVIGGHETDIDLHPWQVSLWVFGRGHSCGGSIISPRFIFINV